MTTTETEEEKQERLAKLWRAIAGLFTVVLPILLYMTFSDTLSELLLPTAPLVDPLPFAHLTDDTTLRTLADWSGRSILMGLSLFLFVLCGAVATFCVFVIYDVLVSHQLIETLVSPKFNSGRLKTARTTIKALQCFTCTLIVLLSYWAGFRNGWNGSNPPIERECFSTQEQYDAAIHPTPDGKQYSWLDRATAATFAFFAGTPSKSGADLIREKAITSLFCTIDRTAGFQTKDLSSRSASSWNILNINTILIYSVSVLIFFTLAILGLSRSIWDLIARGRRLKILLVSEALLLSVGVAQLRSYMTWPAGLLDDKYQKSFIGLAEAHANYIGLTGSATLFAAFAFPLLVWQRDLQNAPKTREDQPAAANEFKFADILAFVSIAAAPALTSSLAKLLSGA